MAERNPQYLGTWMDGDTVHIDSTHAFSNYAEAMRFAMENQQLAIYNTDTGETVNVPDMHTAKLVSDNVPQDPNQTWEPSVRSPWNPEGDYIDLPGTIANAQKLDTEWQSQPTPIQDQAIMQAFRVALLSPRKHIKWNAAHAQALMNMSPHTKAMDLWNKLEIERETYNQKLGYDADSHLSYRRQLQYLAHKIQESNPQMSYVDAHTEAKRVIFEKTKQFEAASYVKDGDEKTELRRYNDARRACAEWLKETYSPPRGWQPGQQQLAKTASQQDFKNGWGVSIIDNGYGSQHNMYELAILYNGRIDYDNPILGDRGVEGWLTGDDIAGLMKRIEALPPKEQLPQRQREYDDEPAVFELAQEMHGLPIGHEHWKEISKEQQDKMIAAWEAQQGPYDRNADHWAWENALPNGTDMDAPGDATFPQGWTSAVQPFDEATQAKLQQEIEARAANLGITVKWDTAHTRPFNPNYWEKYPQAQEQVNQWKPPMPLQGDFNTQITQPEIDDMGVASALFDLRGDEPKARQIDIPSLTNGTEYITAMHELGHVALKLLSGGLSDTHDTQQTDEEARVWNWALSNSSIPITPEMYDYATRALQTYETHIPQHVRDEPQQYTWLNTYDSLPNREVSKTSKTSETIAPPMPDLNYVLDYNPEDKADLGWWSYVMLDRGGGALDLGFTPEQLNSPQGISWEDARDFLYPVGSSSVKAALKAAIPNKPWEYRAPAATWRIEEVEDWRMSKTAEVAMPDLEIGQAFDFDNPTFLENEPGWRAFVSGWIDHPQLCDGHDKFLNDLHGNGGRSSAPGITWNEARNFLQQRCGVPEILQQMLIAQPNQEAKWCHYNKDAVSLNIDLSELCWNIVRS